MVTGNSSTRLSSLKKRVLLTQTDTTVGFISQNASRLREIKSRENKKAFIEVFNNLHTLKTQSRRIPNRFKKELRRTDKTTYIVKNRAFRIAQAPLDSEILRKLSWVYSTSANKSGKQYEKNFCHQKADIIIEDKNGLFEAKASKLYKINNTKKKRLR